MRFVSVRIIIFLLFQIYSTIYAESRLEPRENFHSRLQDACNIYEEALPNFFDDVLRLFRDTLDYVFLRWPEIPLRSGEERVLADKDTLAKGSLVLEKSILKVQALIIKDVGRILDEIAEAIDLASILKRVKTTGFKLHVI